MAPTTPRTTTCWRAGEVSLARDSFNSIVQSKPMDVTEVMMKNSSMGRQAELGPNWCPAGLVTRQLTEALTAKRNKKVPRHGTEPARAQIQFPDDMYDADREFFGDQSPTSEPAIEAPSPASEFIMPQDCMRQSPLPPLSPPMEGIMEPGPEAPLPFLQQPPELDPRPMPPHVPPRSLESPWGTPIPIGDRPNSNTPGSQRLRAAPAWGRCSPPRSVTPAAAQAASPAAEATRRSPEAEASSRLVLQGSSETSAPATARGPAPARPYTKAPLSAREPIPQRKPCATETTAFMPHVAWEKTSRPSTQSGPGKKLTTAWRPNEQSLLRNSFNSIVASRKLDVTEVMMRDCSMGRQAELGPNWCPAGLVSRRMAEILMDR
eukprot:TRINITY_DN80078_c0_g1_i1.p1 TRINITY_DN80078_c0_g1~~TRINITY_DN80078_c0_g1_i1.p1  ORF type:complete len:393 (+),score=59.51 TRINITY_DN80078_c0_g1_i1:49-1179(+)